MHAIMERKIETLMKDEGMRYEVARRVLKDRAAVADRIRRDPRHGTRWGKEF